MNNESSCSHARNHIAHKAFFCDDAEANKEMLCDEICSKKHFYKFLEFFMKLRCFCYYDGGLGC